MSTLTVEWHGRQAVAAAARTRADGRRRWVPARRHRGVACCLGTRVTRRAGALARSLAKTAAGAAFALVWLFGVVALAWAVVASLAPAVQIATAL